LVDVNVNIGSAVYTGVINNIIRDLSLERQKAFKIELVLDYNGLPIAPNPKVDILANRMVLYKNWIPGEEPEIDIEINFYKPTDSGYYINDLITQINTSECFNATSYGVFPKTLSVNIIRLSSLASITEDLIKSDKMNKLSADHLIETTLVFGEKKVFKTEKNLLEDLAVDGDYYIDYVNGIAYSYTLPSGNFFVSYQYNIFPLEVEICDIQLFTLNDDDFVSELFDQETLPSGETTNGLLNSEGAEIYHDVYKNNPIFWGE
jgi:hypothetical protein